MDLLTSNFRLTAGLSLLTMLSSVANANDWQPLASIAQAAENAVSALAAAEAVSQRTLRIESAALDPRLRVPRCHRPLQAHLSPAAAQSTRPVVEVSCTHNARWRLNVPVTVFSELPVLIAKRNLSRGTPLDRQDFAAARRTVAGLAHNKFVAVDNLVGRQLQRPLASGAALEYGMLETQWYVRRGQPVTLLALSDSFEIRTQGVALRDAQRGERLSVRNAHTQKVIEGVVTGESTVLIPP